MVQITSENPTIMVSINHDNYTNEVIEKNNKFNVSILPVDIDKEIIGKFGYFSSKNINKFDGVNTPELDGIKYLKDAVGVMSCSVIERLETETHTVFLASVSDAIKLNDKKVMTYEYYHEVLKGKSPKNAPTYIEEKEVFTKKIYKCQVCGVKKDMFVVKE